jgi:sulfite reductase alpha subunit-like flavoprotein
VFRSSEEDWVKWKKAFLPAMTKQFLGDVVDVKSASAIGYQSSFTAVFDEDEGKFLSAAEPSFMVRRSSVTRGGNSGGDVPFEAKVAVVRDLRNTKPYLPPGKIKDTTVTVHIELDISELDVAYRTADNLGVFPRNQPDLVNRLATRMNLDLHKQFKLQPNDPTS